ncbi:hypothetical protein [Streptomyces sp. NPDC056707]|uniref:hypothetical protein n=1 Tax=Streptomyces sp. NPDC056707 TaxID=3345919 RepID=UPI00369E154C
MFSAYDTTTDMTWFRLRDCAARFGSLFCNGWQGLGDLVRTDCTFLPVDKDQKDHHPFDHALVREMGLLVLAEWNDPDVWLWLQDERVCSPPPALADVYDVLQKTPPLFKGPLENKAFSPQPEGWRCSRCGRYPNHLGLSGHLNGVPMYACAGSEVAGCLS